MEDSFITFQSFNDIALANELGKKLKAEEIEFRVERAKPILDKVYTGSVLEQDILIKLLPTDFEKANSLLENYYDQEIESLDPEYFLFDSNEKELFDVIAKYDEWGPMNVRLARKLLREKGYDIDNITQQAKKQRLIELSEPEHADSTLLAIAYVCSIILPPIAFFIGRNLSHSKRILPTGATIFLFHYKDRKIGNRVMIVSVIMLIAIIITLMTLYFFDKRLFV